MIDAVELNFALEKYKISEYEISKMLSVIFSSRMLTELLTLFFFIAVDFCYWIHVSTAFLSTLAGPHWFCIGNSGQLSIPALELSSCNTC